MSSKIAKGTQKYERTLKNLNRLVELERERQRSSTIACVEELEMSLRSNKDRFLNGLRDAVICKDTLAQMWFNEHSSGVFDIERELKRLDLKLVDVEEMIVKLMGEMELPLSLTRAMYVTGKTALIWEIDPVFLLEYAKQSGETKPTA